MSGNIFSSMLKATARKVLPVGSVRGVLRHWLRGSQEETVSVSSDYALVDPESATHEQFNGWYDYGVAEYQDDEYRGLIQQMYVAQPRQDFVVAADAVRSTGLNNPLILEVGCGSGYYSEILSYLLGCPVRYIGLDYSQAMICLALARYPGLPFVVGDATALPFSDGTFDIVLNGVALMHILRGEAAITESCRVARRWCIFHTVPVLQHRKTTILRKKAYGQPTIEVIFNEAQLRRMMTQNGLAVRYVLDSIPYNLKPVLGETTVTKTYVCKVTEC